VATVGLLFGNTLQDNLIYARESITAAVTAFSVSSIGTGILDGFRSRTFARSPTRRATSRSRPSFEAAVVNTISQADCRVDRRVRSGSAAREPHHPIAEYPIALFDPALVQASRDGSAERRSRRAVTRAWPGSGELGWRRRNSAAGTIRRTLPCPSRIVTGAMDSSCEGSLTAFEESFILIPLV
jgi:hypothetical protein